MIQEKKLIIGNSRSGKTTYLTNVIVELNLELISNKKPLILAINYRQINKIKELLLIANPQFCLSKIRTPFGLMIEDVKLFYPLICNILNLKTSSPLRLRPETEQELAEELWYNYLTSDLMAIFGGKYNTVRRILDLMSLATAGGIIPEDIPLYLQKSAVKNIFSHDSLIGLVGELILKWRNWCLEKGLLSYGLIYELYYRYLLPSSQYQDYLFNQYNGIFADDVDDYPAIMAKVSKLFLNHGKHGVFTYNETGKVRLGFNSDPQFILSELSSLCSVEKLGNNINDNLSISLETIILNSLKGSLINENNISLNLQKIVSHYRGDLLTKTAKFINDAIQSRRIKADEIAIIAPGLDEIARYTFFSYFQENNIKVKFLNEQKPLISDSLIRSILTLLTFLYRGLGRLITKDGVAEMLVILSREEIDLVRGNLLADYCYYPDIFNPSLLTVDVFPRWDRLSYNCLSAYNKIREWLAITQNDINENRLSFLYVIDKIINDFFPNIYQLGYTRLSNLKQFQETAQHFWQIQRRLNNDNIHDIISQFILLLRKGTITANPLILEDNVPDDAQKEIDKALTISTIYQYRQHRGYHRWQFWFDSTSTFWGVNPQLFGASAFLTSGEMSSLSRDNIKMESEEETLERVIRDLLARVKEKVFLCHSHLNINGNEQTGRLLWLTQNIEEVKV